MADSPQITFPELVFGFVAPMGAEIAPTIDAFRAYFQRREYRVVEIKVTDLFSIFQQYIKPDVPLITRGSEKERYETFIDYGNQLRARFDDSILAAAAIRRLMTLRLRLYRNEPTRPRYSRTVYLIHQFKRREEIELFRSVYGRLFFQVSIYSRRGARVDYLSRKFASSDNTAGAQKYRDIAEHLTQRDENEVGEKHGQRVAAIFHDADFILSLDAPEPVREQVDRFCELLFGSNSLSPTRREYGLFLAKAAALRALDLSRQVGAAIFGASGEIISLGSNEVPRGGGGTYWADDPFDDRDFKRKRDSNADRKREILGELAGIIKPGTDVDALLADPKIKDSQFMDALEYGRMVHAEMSALSDAARLGRSVRDGTLFCTTFPCHMCAKHIVASGVASVVFLEPYPKSLATDLHSDSIQVEGGDRGKYQLFPAVQFEHFHGVTPRRYREIFERGRRKDDKGAFQEYINDVPQPTINVKFPFYAELEGFLTDNVMAEIARAIDDDGQPARPKKARRKSAVNRRQSPRRNR